MYTNNRDAYRQLFFTVWQKHLKKLPLELIESQLLDIILEHPEYHRFLDESYQQQAFSFEENPFIHMSLHLALREQLNNNRPTGITHVYKTLMKKYQHHLDVEHLMMSCLIKMLWQGQQTGMMASDEEYLRALQQVE